jgi:hypothetical protein
VAVPVADLVNKAYARATLPPVGAADQFAKTLFAAETSFVTHGAFSWLDAVEHSLAEVRLDGILVRSETASFLDLPDPWPLALPFPEIVTELKMPGDHLDPSSLERALLRRQARLIHHLNRTRNAWPHPIGLWYVADRLPGWLTQKTPPPARRSPGCYEIPAGWWHILWVASNELPLHEALIPLLITRSGEPLAEFARWVVERRPVAWMMRMLEFVTMTEVQKAELWARLDEIRDPEVERNRAWLAAQLAKSVVEKTPELVGEIAEALPAEQRLAGLAPEQRLAGLAPEQRLAGLAPEQRLADLGDRAILAMPDRLLKMLPDEAFSNLPADVRDAIRKRIGR